MKFQHKKFFGQNFLSNKNILQTLVDAAHISNNDVVLEVGPGRGSLTELLALHAKKVIAIEKDKDLIPILQERFAKSTNVHIVEGDILHLKPGMIKIKQKYKIAANIPYYITGKFLRIFLTEAGSGLPRPDPMVLMVQKEVAERIAAKDGKESLLSLSVKAYGVPSIVRVVPRGAFSPPPKVDSAILKIESISDAWFRKNSIRSDSFFEMLRKAFQQKRKMIKKSLKTALNIEHLWKKRPEELSLEDWKTVFLNISK